MLEMETEMFFLILLNSFVKTMQAEKFSRLNFSILNV